MDPPLYKLWFWFVWTLFPWYNFLMFIYKLLHWPLKCSTWALAWDTMVLLLCTYMYTWTITHNVMYKYILMKFSSTRRIAYQESSHSFAVVSCRIDVASSDDPKTFKPLRQRYRSLWYRIYREIIFEGENFHKFCCLTATCECFLKIEACPTHGPPTCTCMCIRMKWHSVKFPAMLYMYMYIYCRIPWLCPSLCAC